MKVEIWADLVCPWCYLGSRNLDKALADFDGADDVEIEWRAFELAPHAPTDGGGTYVDRLTSQLGLSPDQARAQLERARAAGAAAGLDLRFDVARPANSFDAHRLVHLAAARDHQQALKDRLFAAVFTEGRTIGDHDTLVELATDVGIAETDVREVLGGDAYADQVRRDQAEARAIGVRGVPFLRVDGRHAVAGAQPPAALLDVLQEVARARMRRGLSTSRSTDCA